MMKTHDQLFTYPAGGRVSQAQIAVYQATGELPLIVASERDDNPGPSLTTSIEDLANAVWRELVPEAAGVRVIEHYPAREPRLGAWDDESFDLVTFEIERPYAVARPVWRPLGAADLATLIGDPDAPRAGRVYVAERRSEVVGDTLVYVEEDGRRRPLPHVRWHSPSGYAWSYAGSGPGNLALSILADHLGERPTHDELYHGAPRCWTLHQAFKWAFIAPAPPDGFRLPAHEIAAWLEQHTDAAGDVDDTDSALAWGRPALLAPVAPSRRDTR